MKKLTMLAAAFVLAAAGCNDAGNSQKAKVTGTDNKTMEFDYPKSITVRAGASTPVEFKVDRKNFDDSVTVTIDQLPDGVTVGEGSTTIAKGSSTASVVLKAADSAKAMKGAFKVTAKSGSMQSGPHDVKIEVVEHKTGDTTRTGDTTKPADDATARKKAELRETTKAKIDATDKAIATLQEHSKTAQGNTKADIDKEITDLQKKRGNLESQLAKIDSTEPSGWDKFSSGVHDAANELNDAAKRAVDKFKK